MTAASDTAAASATPAARAQLPRAIAFLLAGFAITFTAALHEQLGFDRTITVIALGVIAVSAMVEWLLAPGAPVRLLLALAAAGGAVAVAFAGTTLGFALALAAWALVNGLLEFIGGALRASRRGDSAILGGLSLMLALFGLLVREDPVAVIGFFGAYAIIAGVLLGIASFDSRRGKPGAAPQATADAAA